LSDTLLISFQGPFATAIVKEYAGAACGRRPERSARRQALRRICAAVRAESWVLAEVLFGRLVGLEPSALSIGCAVEFVGVQVLSNAGAFIEAGLEAGVGGKRAMLSGSSQPPPRQTGPRRSSWRTRRFDGFFAEIIFATAVGDVAGFVDERTPPMDFSMVLAVLMAVWPM